MFASVALEEYLADLSVLLSEKGVPLSAFESHPPKAQRQAKL
jgi:hypothetical protein